MSNKFVKLRDEIRKRRDNDSASISTGQGPTSDEGTATNVEEKGPEPITETLDVSGEGPIGQEEQTPSDGPTVRPKRRSSPLTKDKVPRKRGRPKGGKRSDDKFQQITLYMPKDLYQGVQKKIRDRRAAADKNYRGPRDMSDLVTRLVEGWDRKE